jgi:hypothetical protein
MSEAKSLCSCTLGNQLLYNYSLSAYILASLSVWLERVVPSFNVINHVKRSV